MFFLLHIFLTKESLHCTLQKVYDEPEIMDLGAKDKSQAILSDPNWFRLERETRIHTWRIWLPAHPYSLILWFIKPRMRNVTKETVRCVKKAHVIRDDTGSSVSHVARV